MIVSLLQHHRLPLKILKDCSRQFTWLVHCNLGDIYSGVGDLKRAKFHLKAAAMARNEVSRKNLGVGIMESKSGNM